MPKTIKSIDEFKRTYLPKQLKEEFEKRIQEFPELEGKYRASQSMQKIYGRRGLVKKEKKEKPCDECGLPPRLCICEELKAKEEEKRNSNWKAIPPMEKELDD